jgi:hypothetical protein
MPALPPDMAPSPNPFQPGSPVNPNAAPGPFQGPPMPQSILASPDLAPSPNPFQPNSPVDPRAALARLAAQRQGPAPGSPLITPGKPSGTSPILGNDPPLIG